MNLDSRPTILLDLSEVLIGGLQGAESSLASRLQLPRDLVQAALHCDDLHRLFCGSISEDSYLESILGRNHWLISVKELKATIRANFHTEVPEMVALLPCLAASANLVLLSDHAREWVSYIKTIHSFWGVFVRAYFSFEIGQEKSTSSTFTRVLSDLHVGSSSCIFVDDNPVNIATAKACGIRSLLFVSARQLREDLAWLLDQASGATS